MTCQREHDLYDEQHSAFVWQRETFTNKVGCKTGRVYHMFD